MATALVTTVDTADDAAVVEARLSEQRARLGDLQRELGAVQEQIGDLLVSRILNGKTDVRRLQAAETRQVELENACAQVEITIAGLAARRAAWHAGEAQRRYETELAELQAIAAAAPAREARYADLASQLVALAGEMLAAREVWRSRADFVLTYRHEHGLGGLGLRTPAPPFVIPASYLTFRRPPVPFARWLDDWRQRHP